MVRSMSRWAGGVTLLLVMALPCLAAPAAPPQRPSDRSSRFPLRRESGGTRSVCVSRLLAHLVPLDDQFDPGGGAVIGLIEGESPRPPALVVQLAGRPPLVLPPRPAGVRLVLLPTPPPLGLWESFPACNATAEPEAPPARSELLRRTVPLDLALQRTLQDLRSRCGGSVQRDGLLPVFGYEHLRDQLPAELPVSCEP
jgi:hypothetical protein